MPSPRLHVRNNNTRVCQCAERRNSELPGRLQCLESLSLVTSNILNSPQDHDDAYTAKSPKTNEETEKWRFRYICTCDPSSFSCLLLRSLLWRREWMKKKFSTQLDLWFELVNDRLFIFPDTEVLIRLLVLNMVQIFKSCKLLRST